MGFIKAIATLVNAFPAVAKLFDRLNSAIKEKNARERYDKKTTAIDAAVRAAANSKLPARKGKRSGGGSKASTVSGGRKGRSAVHNRGSKKTG